MRKKTSSSSEQRFGEKLLFCSGQHTEVPFMKILLRNTNLSGNDSEINWNNYVSKHLSDEIEMQPNPHEMRVFSQEMLISHSY